MDSCRLFSSVIDKIDELEIPSVSELKELRNQINTSQDIDSEDKSKLDKLIGKVEGLKKKLDTLREKALNDELDKDCIEISKLHHEIENTRDSNKISAINTVAKGIDIGAEWGEKATTVAKGIAIVGTVLATIPLGPFIPLAAGAACYGIKRGANSTHTVLDKELKVLKDYKFLKPTEVKKQIEEIKSNKGKEFRKDHKSLTEKLKNKEIAFSIEKVVKLISKYYKYKDEYKARHEAAEEILKNEFEKAKECSEHTKGYAGKVFTDMKNRPASPSEPEKKNETKASES